MQSVKYLGYFRKLESSPYLINILVSSVCQCIVRVFNMPKILFMEVHAFKKCGWPTQRSQ